MAVDTQPRAAQRSKQQRKCVTVTFSRSKISLAVMEDVLSDQKHASAISQLLINLSASFVRLFTDSDVPRKNIPHASLQDLLCCRLFKANELTRKKKTILVCTVTQA